MSLNIVRRTGIKSLYFGLFPVFFTVILFLVLSGCKGGSNTPFFLPGTPPKATITSITAVAGNTTVNLAWSSVSSATSYNIYRSLQSAQKGTRIASVSSAITSYTDTGLSNNIPYYYQIAPATWQGEIGQSSQVSATPLGTSGPNIIINGTVLYQDKEYGLDGFTSNQPYKPVRYAVIEIIDSAATSTAPPLATGVTGTDGSYTISLPTSTSLSVYVRVDAEATPDVSPVPIEVRNFASEVYSFRGNNFIPSGDTSVNIAVPAASIGGAFNILDVLTNGFNFVNSLQSYPTATLNAYWSPGNAYGTYYCSTPDPNDCFKGEGIYVLNSRNDTDEYDDDVLYHEFGHFIAAHFSKDDSQGGIHGLTDDDLDMRLAWSEGWGDAMPGNVKLWLNSTGQANLLSSAVEVPLTAYIDTNSGGAGVSIDMDSPDGMYTVNGQPEYLTFKYACGEVAIAKILLDLNQKFNMQNVWEVVSSYTTSVPSTPVNLELFWDRWHLLSEPTFSSSTSIDAIFANRSISYSSDLSSSSTYTVGVTYPTDRTLYPDGDEDIISFETNTSQHYTITTFNLRNGADTYIELLPSLSSQPTLTNDNPYGSSYSGTAVPSDYWPNLCDLSTGVCHDNGFDILGSSLAFYAPAYPTTLYVRVKSSPDRPVSAGRYGTYALKITSP